MTKHIYRIITMVAVCSMLAAVLTYSRAMAEDPSDAGAESNICMLDALDTGTLDLAPISSPVPAADDVEINACAYGSCTTTSDCPKRHPAAPFACATSIGCCVPL